MLNTLNKYFHKFMKLSFLTREMLLLSVIVFGSKDMENTFFCMVSSSLSTP